MNIDHKRFLGERDLIAPCFPHSPGIAWAEGRRIRVPGLQPGWWRLAVIGRKATVTASALPAHVDWTLANCVLLKGLAIKFDGVPRIVNHSLDRQQIYFTPEEELPTFSPVAVRVWDSRDLIFEAIGFERGWEEEARRALEDGRTLDDIPHVSAELRKAFTLALIEKVSRELRVPVGFAEIAQHFDKIRDEGWDTARRVLREIAARRVVAEVAARRRHDRIDAQMDRGRASLRTEETFEDRAEAALVKAGARLLSVRAIGNARAEVRWSFVGQRLEAIVESNTLRVVDAGICLTDHYTGERGDDRFTLESLPAVVQEALDGGELVVLRRWA